MRRIERYTITLSQIGTAYRHVNDGKACRISLHHILPALGQYQVQVVAHTALGASPTLTQIINLRDYLIVSLGDSLASGESVPDSIGEYKVHLRTVQKTIHTVQWKDRRCHRSARSGPALTAEAIENANSHTSVTFVSFACSGAEVKNLIDTPYNGSESRGEVGKLDPQVIAASKLVGASAPNGDERTIDALLLTAGINDLQFADIVGRCATNNNHRKKEHLSCVTKGGVVRKAIDALPSRFARLAQSIDALLPRVSEVYINDYPSSPFDGGGCGLLGIPGIGIDKYEADVMHEWGDKLSRVIRRAADSHRIADRWNFVESLGASFGPHAYCRNDTWFTALEESLRHQGNDKGTAHPNRAGHRAFETLLRRAVVLDQPTSPFRQATVVIDELKLGASDLGPRFVRIAMPRYQGDVMGVERYVTVPSNGEWSAVPPEIGILPTLSIFLAPASPRHATGISVYVDSVLPIQHNLADNFGAGAHELANQIANVAVRYHVIVVDPASQQIGPSRMISVVTRR